MCLHAEVALMDAHSLLKACAKAPAILADHICFDLTDLTDRAAQKWTEVCSDRPSGVVAGAEQV